MAAFAGGLKERRKIVQSGIERLLKTKIQQTQTVNKVNLAYSGSTSARSEYLTCYRLEIDTSRIA